VRIINFIILSRNLLLKGKKNKIKEEFVTRNKRITIISLAKSTAPTKMDASGISLSSNDKTAEEKILSLKCSLHK